MNKEYVFALCVVLGGWLSCGGAQGQMSPALRDAMGNVPIVETYGSVNRNRSACPAPFCAAYVFAWSELPYAIDLQQGPDGSMTVLVNFNSIDWKGLKERAMLEQVAGKLGVLIAQQQAQLSNAQCAARAAERQAMQTGLMMPSINAQGNAMAALRELNASRLLVGALQMRYAALAD